MELCMIDMDHQLTDIVDSDDILGRMDQRSME